MPKSQLAQQNWQGLVAEFQHTSDRAVVILGSTYLQNHLGHLIRSFIVDHPENSANLLEAESPLGGFGPRIYSAYALGLISPNELHDLSLILKIRNQFLAQLNSLKFTDDDFSKICNLLKIPREVLHPEETPTPRRLFVFAIALLVGQLSLRAEQAERNCRIPPDNFILIDVER